MNAWLRKGGVAPDDVVLRFDVDDEDDGDWEEGDEPSAADLMLASRMCVGR